VIFERRVLRKKIQKNIALKILIVFNKFLNHRPWIFLKFNYLIFQELGGKIDREFLFPRIVIFPKKNEN